MMRLSTVFLCFLLAASAAGRYQAEAHVRAGKLEVRKIEQALEEGAVRLNQLQLEVGVLESSQRLSQLATHRLSLTSVKPKQLQSAEEFASLLQLDTVPTVTPKIPSADDFIINAIAMANFGKAP